MSKKTPSKKEKKMFLVLFLHINFLFVLFSSQNSTFLFFSILAQTQPLYISPSLRVGASFCYSSFFYCLFFFFPSFPEASLKMVPNLTSWCVRNELYSAELFDIVRPHRVGQPCRLNLPYSVNTFPRHNLKPRCCIMQVFQGGYR